MSAQAARLAEIEATLDFYLLHGNYYGRPVMDDIRWLARELARVQREAAALREAAKRAKSVAAAPDYDEEAIRDALWAVVDLALARGGQTDE